MHKSRFVLLSFLILFLLLCLSCASFNSIDNFEDITEEEASEALHTALNTASENANTEFYRQIAKDSYLPEEYTVMASLKDTVPGFPVMMENWRAYVEEYIYTYLEEFYTYVNERLSGMTFEDPLYYVKSSDTSITSAFSALYADEIKAFWRERFENLETWNASDLVNQYTNWTVSRDLIYGTQSEALKTVDMKDFLAEHLTELYLENLAREEELFRTTPDPYGDEVARKVFRTY